MIEWLPGLVDRMRLDPKLGARDLDGAGCQEQNQLPTEPISFIARLGEGGLLGWKKAIIRICLAVLFPGCMNTWMLEEDQHSSILGFPNTAVNITGFREE